MAVILNNFYMVCQYIGKLEKLIQTDDSWDKIAEFNEVSDDNIKFVTRGATKGLQPLGHLAVAFRSQNIF